MITDKDIRNAVRKCEWKSENRKGLYLHRGICTAKYMPCKKAIDEVECPVLKELFKKELNNGSN